MPNAAEQPVRNELARYLYASVRSWDKSPAMCEEMELPGPQGLCRADLMVLHRCQCHLYGRLPLADTARGCNRDVCGFHGYEIKTKGDSLARLPKQIAAYDTLCDKASAVLATRHMEKAMEMLPKGWGVIEIKDDADEGLNLRTIREPMPNLQLPDKATLSRLLWKSEITGLLKALGLEASRFDSVSGQRERLEPRLTPIGLRDVVIHAILSRANYRSLTDPSKPRLLPLEQFEQVPLV